MATATTSNHTKPTEATQLQHLIAKTRYLGHSDLMIFEVPSRTHAGEVYRVLGDRRSGGANCHCASFRHRGTCAHAKAAKVWMAMHRETERQQQERRAARWREDYRLYDTMGGAYIERN